MRGNILLVLLVLIASFLVGLQLGGCKEKQGLSVREVKQEASSKVTTQTIIFEPSKVASNVKGGVVDLVEPTKVTLDTKIHIGGWAADLQKTTPARVVVIVVDGKQIPVFIHMGAVNREDVAKAFKSDNLVKTGWDVKLNASILGKGKHKLEFYALLGDDKFAPLVYKGKRFCEIEVVK